MTQKEQIEYEKKLLELLKRKQELLDKMEGLPKEEPEYLISRSQYWDICQEIDRLTLPVEIRAKERFIKIHEEHVNRGINDKI